MVRNKENAINNHIDELVVKHLEDNTDCNKYGDYVDMNEYEKYRRILK